jgi:hypothetical protein
MVEPHSFIQAFKHSFIQTFNHSFIHVFFTPKATGTERNVSALSKVLICAYSNCVFPRGYIGYPYLTFAAGLIQFAALPRSSFLSQRAGYECE